MDGRRVGCLHREISGHGFSACIPAGYFPVQGMTSRIPVRYKFRATLAAMFRRRLTASRNQFLNVACSDCRGTQHATLSRLLYLNRDSAFSADHRLQPRLTVAEFRKRIPVSDYELVRPYIDRMQTGDHQALLGTANKLLMYAVTSGTTAASKLIPVTEQFVDDYRRGWQHWGVGAHTDHHILRQLNMVQLTSSHDQWRAADGVPCGNISGLVAAMQSRVVKSLYSVPAAVAQITDPESKKYAAVRFAVEDPWVGMLITANPSTLLQVAELAADKATELIRDIYDGTLTLCEGSKPAALQRFLRKNPARARTLESHINGSGFLNLAQCWPRLYSLGVWTGGSAAAYLPELSRKFGDLVVRDHGLHASEGRMTIPTDDHTPAGILDIESHFFEFVPVEEEDAADPTVLEAHEISEGCDYFILMTTSSGLYRYNIRDVVRCVGFYRSAPILEFLHKGASVSSITGEKVAESQVVTAVREAAVCEDLLIRQFTLTPHWGDPPYYRLFVQNGAHPCSNVSLSQVTQRVDCLLRSVNCEYNEKRETGRIGPVRTELLSDKQWRRFRSSRLKRNGGSPEQYKHPFLLPDPRFEGLFLRDCGTADNGHQHRSQ